MTYLVFPEPTEEELQTCNETPIELGDMHYLYSYLYNQNEEDGSDPDYIDIVSIFAAHDINLDKLYAFATVFRCTKDDSTTISRLAASPYFVYKDSNNDTRAEMLINFFAAPVPYANTDFRTTYDADKYQYIFYSHDDDGIHKYAMSSNINTGIQIINRCFSCGMLYSDHIEEANIWMGNDTALRYVTYEYDVYDFHVEELSKSIKHKDSDIYTGVVVIKFYHMEDGIPETDIATMVYNRKNKVKKRGALEVDELKNTYGKDYSIMSYSCVDANTGKVGLLAFKVTEDNLNRYIKLNMTTELQSRLISTIESF